MGDADYLISIVLRARDEMGRALANARGEVAALRGEFNELDGTLTKVNNNISSLNRRLGNLRSRMQETRGDMQDVGSRTRTVANEMDHAGRSAGGLSNNMRQTSRSMRDTDRDARGLFQRIEQMGLKFEQAGIHVRSLGSEMRGILILGVIGFFQQLATVAISLGGNLVALAGSASMAGAAIGGALTAGVAQAIPALGLLIAAFQRVGVVMDALQQQQNAQQQNATQAATNANQQADAAGRVADAQDALVSANYRLANAQQTLQDAQERLTEARRDAREELDDLAFSERRAELAARGASISVEEAQRELREALQSGDDLAIRQARLGLDQARLAREEAKDNLQDVRRDSAEARREGVKGNDQVVDAARAVTDAKRGIEEARRGLAAARRNIQESRADMARANTEAVTAQRNLDFLLSQMSESERALYQSLLRLKGRYADLIRPITDTIIDSFTRTTDRLADVLGDPRILGGLEGIAEGIADSIDRIVDRFTSDRALGQFSRIMEQSAENLRPLTGIAIRLGEIFLDIAEAAGPALGDIIEWVGDLTEKFRDFIQGARQDGSLQSFFQDGVTHLQAWVGLLGAIINLFAALTGPGGGAESGLRIVNAITDGINGWADSVRENADEVEKFFRRSEAVLGQVWRVIEALAIALYDAFDEESVEALANILIEVVIPALADIIDIIGEIVKGIEALLGNEVIGQLARWTIVILGVWRAFATLGGMLGTLLRNFGIMGRLVVGAPGALVGGFGLLITRVGALKDAFRALAGGQGIGAAIEAYKNFIRRSDAAKDAAKKTATAVTPATGAAPAPGARVVTLPDGRQVLANSPAARAAEAEAAAARTSRTARVGGAVARGAGAVGSGALALAGGPAGAAVLGGITIVMAGQANRASRAADADAFSSQFLTRMSQGSPADVKVLETWLKLQREGIGAVRMTSEEYEEFRKKNNKVLEEAGVTARTSKQDIEALGDAYDEVEAKQRDVENAVSRALRRTPDQLRNQRIKAEDVLDPNMVAQFLSNLKNMREQGFTSINDLRKDMKFNIDAITVGFEEGTDSWAVAMSRNFGRGIRDLKEAMRDGEIGVGKGMREINRITKQQMTFVRDNFDTLSLEAKDRFAENFRAARLAMERQAGGIEEASEKTLRRIRRLMTQELELYGLSPEQARRLARNRTTPGREDVDQWGRQHTPGSGQGAAGGAWWIGNRGERGRDGDAYVSGVPVGRGELLVANAAQQMQIDRALHGQFGYGIDELTRKVRGAHAGALGGGWAGGAAPSRGGLASLIKLGRWMREQGYAVGENAALGDPPLPGIHSATGWHYRNGGSGAIDVNADNFPGGEMAALDRLASQLQRAGWHILWRVADHFDHLHVDLEGGGGGVPAFFRNLRKVTRRQATVDGADKAGLLGGIAQAGADTLRVAANDMLSRAIRSFGAGDETESAVKAAGADADVVSAFRRAIRSTGSTGRSSLALWMAGIVESGLRNLTFGDADSQGALQLRTGIHGVNLAMNPFASAVAFLTRGFYGRGGAIDLAASNPQATAGWIAQQVQGSAFPDRYDQVRAQAMRYMRFMFGGPVPGYGGGDKHPALLEGGEHVITKEEVQHAGGHGVIAALRRLWGGGGQGGPFRYAQGGEVLQIGDSLSVGMREALKKLVDGLVSDVRVGRNSDEAFDRLKRKLKESYEAVIFDVGTNDAQASTLHKNLKRAYRLLDNDQTLFLSTVNGPGAAAKNRILRRFARSRDNVELVDANDIPTGSDGIHLTPDGYRKRARLFAGALRAGGNRLADMPTYELPDFDPQTVAGVLREFRRLNKVIGKLSDKGGDSLAQYVRQFIEQSDIFIREGGLFDQLTASIERRSGLRDLRQLQAQFNRRGGRVVRQFGERGEARRDERDAELLQRDLRRARNQINEFMFNQQRRIATVTQRIQELRSGGITDAERKEIDRLKERRQTLRGQQRTARDRLLEIQQAIADAIQAQWEAQIRLIELAGDRVNTRAERRGAAVERANAIRERLGQAVDTTSMTGIIRDQIAGLTTVMNRLNKAGAHDQAAQIAEQIKDLQAQIVNIAIDNFERTVEQINERAGNRSSRIDIASRALRVGLTGIAQLTTGDRRATTEGALFSLRDSNLRIQRQELTTQLYVAALQGNKAAVETLTQQVRDLDVQIAENTEEARAFRIDRINERAQFVTGAAGSAINAVNALTELAGTGQNTGVIASITRTIIGALQSQAGGLRNELQQLLGIDTGQLSSPEQINEFLNRVLPLIANLPDSQREAAQGLVDALLGTIAELAENTKQLRDLNGAPTGQSFSTSLWDMFRIAVFNGNGSPLYGSMLPQFASGVNAGPMPWDGPAYLHKGEIVVNPSLGQSVGGDSFQFNVTTPTIMPDPDYFFQVAEFHRSQRRAT